LLVFIMYIDSYRGFGIALTFMGLILGVYSYMVFGLSPLVALWIGVMIVGLSIILTPSHVSRRSRELAVMMNSLFINIVSIMDSMRVSSHNLFKAYGDKVYIYLSRGEIENPSEELSTGFITISGGMPIIKIFSPIDRTAVEGIADPCSAIDRIIVEHMDIADGVECYIDSKSVIRIRGPVLSSPYKLERSLGGIYGLIVGSIMALYMGSASIEYVESSKDYIVISMRVGIDKQGSSG